MSTKISDAQNFLDVNALNDIKLKSKSTNSTDKKEALKEVAKQFESLFTQMLLKSMRKAQEVLESDSPFNSQSVKFYRDMHDQQLAVELSDNGSLGLAPLIVRQLGGDTEHYMPSSALRNNANLKTHEINQTKNALGTISLDKSNQNDGYSLFEHRSLNLPLTPLHHQTNHQLITPLKSNQTKIFPKGTLLAPDYAHPKDFVTAITLPAKRAEQVLGVPFKVIIAQAALETGWGQKVIKTEKGQSSNNLFNIKADERWQGEKTNKETLEYQQGSMVKTKAPFRVYQSINDSFNDFVHFLSSSERYQNALKQTDDVEQFLQGLQSAGYATDPNYADKILSTLSKVSDLLNE